MTHTEETARLFAWQERMAPRGSWQRRFNRFFKQFHELEPVDQKMVGEVIERIADERTLQRLFDIAESTHLSRELDQIRAMRRRTMTELLQLTDFGRADPNVPLRRCNAPDTSKPRFREGRLRKKAAPARRPPSSSG